MNFEPKVRYGKLSPKDFCLLKIRKIGNCLGSVLQGAPACAGAKSKLQGKKLLYATNIGILKSLG